MPSASRGCGGGRDVASNQLVLGDSGFELEVNSTRSVPILVFANYIPADPASIVLVLRDPESNVFTFTYPVGATLLTRSAVGVYAFGSMPVLVGRHVGTVTTTVPNLVSSFEFTAIDNGVN
jgi:hypothetical protein